MAELWLKAIHVVALSIWSAGILAIPGLLGVVIRRADGTPDDEALRQLNFARLAYERVVSPAALFTVASGTALIFIADFQTEWLALKLVAVGVMALMHMVVGRGLGHGGRHYAPGRSVRLVLAVAIATSVLAVLALVLAKPAIDLAWLPAWLTEGRPMGAGR